MVNKAVHSNYLLSENAAFYNPYLLSEMLNKAFHYIYILSELLNKAFQNFYLLSELLNATVSLPLSARLTQQPKVLGLTPGLATYLCFFFSLFAKGSCQLLVKVMVNWIQEGQLLGTEESICS